MATRFITLDRKAKGLVPLYVRIQNSKPKVNIRLKTGLKVLAQKWALDRNGPAWARYSTGQGVSVVISKTEEIRTAIDSRLRRGECLTSGEVRRLCDKIIYREEHEEQMLKASDGNSKSGGMTLTKYMRRYLEEIGEGNRQTDRGTAFAPGSVSSIRNVVAIWEVFQKEKRTKYDFDDIDLSVYYKFTGWMKGRNFSINTMGKCIKILKSILHCAEHEGYNRNTKFKDKRFKGISAEVDSIYLTKEDLNKFSSVNLDGMPSRFGIARDIFLIGCWTAQRISDYNNISPDSIHTYTKRSIVDVPDPEHPGQVIPQIQKREVTYITIRQRKTGATVAVPCSSELKAILEKYNYKLPHLQDSIINSRIKTIGKMAGINEIVEVIRTQGGTRHPVKYEKWQLICSHTARRTGATLMYLSGMDMYDIMKITGHTSPVMLKKYIKADHLEVVDKIIDKYDYFD